MSAVIETGTNLVEISTQASGGNCNFEIGNVCVDCLQQVSDLVEAAYFLYFYIYEIVVTGTVEYIEEVFTDTMDLINAIAKGPCWIIGSGEWEPLSILITEPEKDDFLSLFFSSEVLEIVMDVINLWLTFGSEEESF